jgi:hypothetical protein
LVIAQLGFIRALRKGAHFTLEYFRAHILEETKRNRHLDMEENDQ